MFNVITRTVFAIHRSYIASSFLNISKAAMTSTAKFPDLLKEVPQINNHDDLHKYSIENPEKFWDFQAKDLLSWQKPYSTNCIMKCDMTKGEFKWFYDGQLNASVNCVDRHAAKTPEKIALIWEKDEPGTHEKVSYKQLQDMICRIANVFLSHGIKRGDVIAIYLPICPLAVASMLACSRIGVIHSVIFAGFSSNAIAKRIQDANAVAIITANEGIRGNKHIPLRKTVHEAIKDDKCPSIKNVFVIHRTDAEDDIQPNDINLEKEMQKSDEKCQPEIMNAEDLLFILYTSGSTGTPKGVAHSTAGYLLYAAFTQKYVFGYEDNSDVFGCVADIGWITGHSYVVYGPLINGGTTLLFESTPTYPDPSRYWDTIEKHQVKQFYCAPTAVRLLLQHGDSHTMKHDRSSLKTIGSVGEPINQEAWHWLNSVIGNGKCDIVDTWWQTETGGICISPRPSEESAPIVPAMPMRPLLGMNPVLLDDKGKEIPETSNVSGALCLKTPWPGIARTVYRDHNRFVQTYFSAYPGYYFSGDGAAKNEEGYWQITGRMDDVINVTGHRLGTAEVEDILTGHAFVAEAAVVGYPHYIKGESVYAYVVLKHQIGDVYSSEKQEELIEELKQLIKTNIAGFAVPDEIQICTGLPKTRSGKIMRRILRKVSIGEYDELGDTSTLADPSIVEEIVDSHSNTPNRKKARIASG